MRAFIHFLLRAWGAAFMAAMLLAATGQSAAMEALGPVGLRARHASLSAQLRTNAFGAPLYIESVETSSSAQGDLYAIVAHPFGKFSTTLTKLTFTMNGRRRNLTKGNTNLPKSTVRRKIRSCSRNTGSI